MKKFYILISSLFFSFFFISNTNAQVNETDSLTLVALYNSTNGTGWADSSWFSGPIATWSGVQVTLNRVTGLNLPSNNLIGSIPPEIGNLDSLNLLNLGGNQLSGPLPTEIGNLTALQDLQLWGNQLTGNLPISIGNLVNLSYLDLAPNQFEGTIPAEIGNLINLNTLWLNHNNFVGDVPVEIANLSSLTALYLMGNQLSGLPNLSNLSSLSTFEVGDNFLTFEDLEPNNSILTGALAQRPFGYPQSYSVSLGGTIVLDAALSGSGINDNYQWYKDLSPVTGATSPTLTISNMTSNDYGTYELVVTNSVFPGVEIRSVPIQVTIPINGTDSLALVSLYNSTDGANWSNSQNWLTAPVSSWFGVTVDSGRVVNINLSMNNLIGELPVEIGNLTALTGLNLGGNQLSGPLPNEIGNLIALQDFQLWGNQISGNLPASIGNLVNLTYLDLAPNAFEGTIPVEIGNLVNLNTLWLNNSLFTGDVPAELNNLTSLNALYLQGNNLTNLPDLSALNLTTFRVEGNYFTFEDILPNMDTIITYAPQKVQGPTYDTLVAAGATLEIIFPIGGTGNTYQWIKDGVPIEGATSATLVLTNLSGADNGSYQLIANNPDVPGLTITTDDFYVSVEGTGTSEGPAWSNAFSFGAEGMPTAVSSIEVDAQNNALIYGDFRGGFDFLGSTITEADSGAFLAKVDPDNNLLSLIHINGGTTIRNLGDYMVHDKISGDTYLSGSLFDSLNIGGVRLTSENPGEKNGFVAKINNAGEAVWIKEFPLFSFIQDLSIKNNELIVSGLFEANIILEGKSLTNYGALDMYIAKYDQDGNNIFVKSIGGTNTEYVSISAIDDAGNFYLTSEATSDTLIYEDGSRLALAEGQGNVLVIKYDASGNILWENTYSGSPSPNGDYYSWPTALTVDPSGNPILSGWFGMKNGFGADTLTSPYQYNKFITQLAPDGTVNWAKAILEEVYGFSYNEMETDAQGNIYFMSEQPGNIYIDGFQYPVEGSTDAYMIKFNSSGETVWMQKGISIGHNSGLSGMGIVEEDALYIGGQFISSQFQLGANVLNSLGSPHGFVATLGIIPGNIENDSLALVALYDATDGANWTNNENWLEGPVNTWFGVGVENNRVVSIALAENNLSGSLPAAINTLSKITSIQVQGNNIVGIPDLSGLATLMTLDVSGNNLQFGSLEPNVGIEVFNYQDQDLIGEATYTEVPIGGDTDVNIVTTGSANTYQWYLNDQLIPGATASTHNITAIDGTTMGDYHVEVQNSTVPGLILVGRVNEIGVTAMVSGQITLSDGNPLDNGKVMLLNITSTEGFDTTYQAPVDASGLYNFEAVLLDNYLLVAVADTVEYPNQFPTYFTRSILWEEADTLIISGNTADIDVQLESVQIEPTQGEGSITGVLEEEVEDGSGKLLGRKRIAGAGVTIRRGRNSGKLSQFPNSKILQDYEIVGYVYTNANGEFSFKNLAEDEYLINIQYPGYPMDETSNINVAVGSKENNKSREVKAVADNGKISVEIVEITAVVDNEFTRGIAVYPNPTSDYLYVKYNSLDKETESVIFDSKGRKVLVSKLNEGDREVFDLRNLNRGIYFLNIYDKYETTLLKSFKIVISH